MIEYMHLVGTEQMSSAANRMLEAAERMSRVVSNLELVHEQHQRFLDEWLARFGDAIKAMPQVGEAPSGGGG